MFDLYNGGGGGGGAGIIDMYDIFIFFF